MKKEDLRKVTVTNDNNQTKYVGYFHEIYKETYWNGATRATAIIELETGELRVESIYDVKFIL